MPACLSSVYGYIVPSTASRHLPARTSTFQAAVSQVPVTLGSCYLTVPQSTVPRAQSTTHGLIPLTSHLSRNRGLLCIHLTTLSTYSNHAVLLDPVLRRWDRKHLDQSPCDRPPTTAAIPLVRASPLAHTIRRSPSKLPCLFVFANQLSQGHPRGSAKLHGSGSAAPATA